MDLDSVADELQGHEGTGRGERAGRIGDGEGGHQAGGHRDGADEGADQPEPAAGHATPVPVHVTAAGRDDADDEADDRDYRQYVQQA